MFDLAALGEAVRLHHRVARVVVAETHGSAPREPGAAMLVWADGQSGTIGGGALEWQATAQARVMLSQGGVRLDRLPLGPSLGQCCGGAVVLVTEVFDAATLPESGLGFIARRVAGQGDRPLAVRRLIDRARGQGLLPPVTLVQGWLVEPVATPRRAVWVWGAGHVGRALVGVLAPLPGLALTWADVARERFPDALPPGVECRWSPDPAEIIATAPPDAAHLVLTFSHALDLDLCHRLLGHGFASLGLIGSATKRARFRTRLAALGHAPAAIGRITCPIGDPALGKHPQAIAIGVAAALLRPAAAARLEAQA